ncbi:hypothetical protein [Streptomyces hiroshimensis]|uniref:Nucleotide exchange factor GrpE n=1 Tax=Streptomyces hiroshimensis TaxID=66424 RepID=A0ABQ2YYS0_9ACTN|nr:hypothetical protein [Streptomyces hiroshimensis]GGX97675.1 hypothetical protein GCM10010324_49870 [Streptomyces hiroshimensis]
MTAEDPKNTEQAGAPAEQAAAAAGPAATPSEEALAAELDKPVEHVEGTAPQTQGGSGPIRPTHTTGAQ